MPKKSELLYFRELNQMRRSGVCVLRGCFANTHARGLCGRHYKQWSIGDAEHEPLPHLSPLEQVLSKVEEVGDCWVWQGGRNGPYGRIRTKAVNKYVHVVAWEAANGPKPIGMELDHQCRNHLCVNIEHLKLVTRKQNLENLGPRKGSASRFRGVTKSHGRWVAQVSHYGKKSRSGLFATEEEANLAAIEMRRALYLNNPEDRGVRYDCPAFNCPRTNHDDCWRDYNQQEDEAKYGRE